MQKLVMALFISLLVFGIALHAPLVISEEGPSPDNSNNSDDGGNNVISAAGDDSDDNETDDDDENETEDDEDELEDDEDELEDEEEFRTIGGEKVKIERKIRIKGSEIGIKTKLKIEGEGANLVIVDSEGGRNMIRVTPERIRMLIIERLNADNITNFSLEEVEHKNIPRVVFKINSDHPGRFLGIFKIAMGAETQVDPETGEIIDVNVPWWAFLITGEEISDTDEIIGNETLEDDLVADDDELEEEFEEVEIEEGFEVNGTEVEVSGDVELSEEAKVTLDSLVSSFKNVESKVELKLKFKKQNNRVSVESEIKGILIPNQSELWNTLIEQVRGLVSSAEGDDIEIEIKIERELEDEDEDELEEEEDDSDEDNNETETNEIDTNENETEVNETNSSA